jgi:hypothetical protein
LPRRHGAARARRVGLLATVALVATGAMPATGAAPPSGATPAIVTGATPPTATPAIVGLDDEVLCRFDSEELDEVSGMALSRRHDDVIWVTNDSGGGPLLYAVSTRTCRIRATLRLLDTPARDHEAVATGVDAEGRDVIWIGDIGDNIDGWPYARIHKVVEPRRLRDARVPVTTYRVRYPGGPVDAEALVAAQDREQLWIISKEPGVGAVFELPSPMSDAQEPMRARRVGTARALITDAAMAPDGERFVVRDYLSAEVFTGEPPGEAEARFRLPIQPQGEAIAWTADSRSVLVASERSPTLVRVDVPRTALGTDGGIAEVLPRVAGFDIYPYVRLLALGMGAVVGLVLLSRVLRRAGRRR